jgi:death on curing protein
MTFEAHDLYPSLTDKASAFCYSLIANHPLVDGNKRIGQAAAETFLLLNGLEISASVDEQESIIMKLASGQATRHDLSAWFHANTAPTKS